jgi:pimeloyl-ACP methyl ester carboxylesterase
MEQEHIETIRLPDPPGLDAPGDGVVAHWHRPADGAPTGKPGIVVLPIQGGDYEISILFARHFAATGHHALRFERRAEWLDASRPPEALAVLLRIFVDDVRRGIDRWLEVAPVGPDLGLFGVSMGAMSGTLVAAKEPRLTRRMLVLGGGPLADILATARDTEINKFRRELAARLGVGEADLFPLFREGLEGLDPLTHAAALDPADTLVISARFDRVVRYSYQTRLWEALGRPRRTVLPCGHYSAAVFVPWIKRRATQWFAPDNS